MKKVSYDIENRCRAYGWSVYASAPTLKKIKQKLKLAHEMDNRIITSWEKEMNEKHGYTSVEYRIVKHTLTSTREVIEQ